MSIAEAINRPISPSNHEVGIFDGLLQRFEGLLINHQRILPYKFDLFLQTNLERFRRRTSSPDSGYNLLFYTYGQSSEDPNFPDLIGSLSWQILLAGQWFDVIKCQIIQAVNRAATKTVYVAGILEAENLVKMKPYGLGNKPCPNEETIDFCRPDFGQLALQAGILPYSDLPPSLDVPGVMQGVIDLAKNGKPGNIREVLGI